MSRKGFRSEDRHDARQTPSRHLRSPIQHQQTRNGDTIDCRPNYSSSQQPHQTSQANQSNRLANPPLHSSTRKDVSSANQRQSSVKNPGRQSTDHRTFAAPTDQRSGQHSKPTDKNVSYLKKPSINATKPLPSIDPVLVAVGDSLNDYTLQDQVGEGTFGYKLLLVKLTCSKVYKATRKNDGAVVALKRVRVEVEKEGLPLTAIREIWLLTKLKHPNVVQLHELLSSVPDGPDLFIYMVFEYMDHDLTGLLASGIKYSQAHIKCLNWQLVEGLAYIHALNVLHRDIKGSNVLLNAKGQLKIAARLACLDSQASESTYTNRVVTLWYRPPELLLGAIAYDKSVDIWSVGCIFLELVTKAPVFCGKDEITQLDKIWRVCGAPDLAVYPLVQELPWWSFLAPLEDAGYTRDFHSRFSPLLSAQAFALIESLLSLDPLKRPCANAILAHPYFKELPLACTPSELPFITGSWHEFDSKNQKKETQAVVAAPVENQPVDPMIIDEPLECLPLEQNDRGRDKKRKDHKRHSRSRGRSTSSSDKYSSRSRSPYPSSHKHSSKHSRDYKGSSRHSTSKRHSMSHRDRSRDRHRSSDRRRSSKKSSRHSSRDRHTSKNKHEPSRSSYPHDFLERAPPIYLTATPARKLSHPPAVSVNAPAAIPATKRVDYTPSNLLSCVELTLSEQNRFEKLIDETYCKGYFEVV